MMNASGFDFFARYTAKNGDVTVQHHRVHDKVAFISARTAEYSKEGGKAKFEQITEDEYKKSKAK